MTLKPPVEASVIKENKRKIEIQMKYTNNLTESFRREFEGSAWRHPKEHDLQILGDLRV